MLTNIYALGLGAGLGQPGLFSSVTGTSGTGSGSGGGGAVGVAAVGGEYALSQQLSEAIRVNLPSMCIYIRIHLRTYML